MSKQSDAKERQMYTPKFVPMTCGNCVHFKCTVTKHPGVFGGVYTTESDRRCNIGGFAVKKMGSCNEHVYVEASK